MAKVTREQVEKLNAKLVNGFKINVMHLFNGEKEFSKEFKTSDGKDVAACVYYMERYDYRTDTKTIYPVVNFNYFTIHGNYRVSRGLGWTMKLDNVPVNRKNFNKLAEFSKLLDDETCRGYFAQLQSTKENIMA